MSGMRRCKTKGKRGNEKSGERSEVSDEETQDPEEARTKKNLPNPCLPCSPSQYPSSSELPRAPSTREASRSSGSPHPLSIGSLPPPPPLAVLDDPVRVPVGLDPNPFPPEIAVQLHLGVEVLLLVEPAVLALGRPFRVQVERRDGEDEETTTCWSVVVPLAELEEEDCLRERGGGVEVPWEV